MGRSHEGFVERPDRTRSRVTHVIVPLDGSEDAARAVPVARQLAERLGSELTVLGVATMESHGQTLWDSIEQVFAESATRLLVVDGPDVARAIVAAAERRPRQLVCMASHGRGRSAALVGSIASSVVHDAHAPVVLLGPAVPADHVVAGRLVGCLDGSANSDELVDATAAWARALALHAAVITVAEPAPEAVVPGPAYHRMHGPDQDADDFIRSVVAAARSRGNVIEGDAVYDPVSVTDGVVRHVHEHPTGMLAVVSSAPTGAARLVAGSTAAAIVRRAPVPVLFVPHLR